MLWQFSLKYFDRACTGRFSLSSSSSSYQGETSTLLDASPAPTLVNPVTRVSDMGGGSVDHL